MAEESSEKPVIEFIADSVKLYGPKLDSGFTVTFTTGEYEQLTIAKLMAISQSSTIKVKVEADG